MVLNNISIEKIREIINPILKDYPVSKAVLFRSYSKGTTTNSIYVQSGKTILILQY